MNSAQFVSFSSSHDLDRVPAGETFTATWRVRNNGATTWGAGYKVVHIHAETGSTLMAGRSSFAFTGVASQSSVSPGENVEITLRMTAPAARDRRYFTDWQLQDPQGRLFGDIIWLRVVTVKPVTAVPSGDLQSNSQFIDDHSIPDGTPIEAGKSFLKQWVVRNTGQRKWGAGFHLVFVSGDTNMTGMFSHPVPEAEPGEEVVISVEMVAPPARDEAYSSSWRIHDNHNTPFGDNLWVKIFSTSKVEGFAVRPFSQNDARWKHRVLGRGSQTFGEFGCLLTCYAMMLTGFGENANPLQLNNRFLQLPANKGFDGSDVFYVAPAAAFDHVLFVGSFRPHANTGAAFGMIDPNLLTRIDQSLARGEAVMAQVDRDPSDPFNLAAEQHWVLLLARQGNDYLALDPINGQSVSLLSKYGRQTTGATALRDAIKSALIYRSLNVTAGAGDVSEGETEGSSNIGPVGELAYTGPAWSFGRCLKGIHDRANRHPLAADHKITRGKFESVKVQSGVTVDEMNGYQAKFVLCRLFESWHGRHVPVDNFIKAVVPDIERLVNAGVKYFEFHNEPNLSHEGLKTDTVQGSWRNGAEFARYFMEGRKKLRARFPGIKVGFPGLSPGASASYQFGPDSGFRLNHKAFLDGAEAGLRAADFICVHAYFLNMDEVRGDAINQVKMYRRRWPDKLLFVTEFSNPNPKKNIPAADRGRQAKEFYQLCHQIPGVGAAYYFIVSGAEWDHQALRRNADGKSTGVVEAMFG